MSEREDSISQAIAFPIGSKTEQPISVLINDISDGLADLAQILEISQGRVRDNGGEGLDRQTFERRISNTRYRSGCFRAQPDVELCPSYEEMTLAVCLFLCIIKKALETTVSSQVLPGIARI